MDDSLKILTYNIHKGFGVANFRFVLHQIRAALEATKADLVFLQEVQGKHRKRPVAQFMFLAENFWPHYAYGKNALYRGGHHGNAILSKFPFLMWENISLAKYKCASRSLLHAVIEIPKINKNMHIICIHFALFKTQSRKQLIVLKNRIIDRIPEDAPLIIAGDFNDWRGQAERFLETELALKEVFKVTQGHHTKTFPIWSPKLAVDRIYYRNLKLDSCQRLHQMPWRKLSDHVPLYAEFLLY